MGNLHNQLWPATLTKIATVWKVKKHDEKKVTGIRLVLQFTAELAEALSDDAPAALAMLSDGSGSAQVRFRIPAAEVVLELHDTEGESDGDTATVRMLDSMRAVARPGEDGPELEVVATWTHYDTDDDVLDFLHRNMGPLGVQLQPRQGELALGTPDQAVRESLRAMQRTLGPDGSMTLEHGGKVVTLKGK